MKKKKGLLTYFILFLVLIAGLSLLLYPTISNYWNSLHATKTIVRYSEAVAEMSDSEIEAIWQAALDYNENLSKSDHSYYLPEERLAEYKTLLNIGNTGVMGYIEIESLDVLLPIYHGTDDAVLEIAAGHVDWSSLPVGGKSSHCIISGHRGLPSAKLFTDLDELREGDTFTLNIVGMVLTYEIDQIRTVLPEETQDLQIVSGMDYCTLMTCTPYGINTHRLLVRGHRVSNVQYESGARVVSEAVRVNPLIVSVVLAVIPLLTLMILVLTKPKKKSPFQLEVKRNEETE